MNGLELDLNYFDIKNIEDINEMFERMKKLIFLYEDIKKKNLSYKSEVFDNMYDIYRSILKIKEFNTCGKIFRTNGANYSNIEKFEKQLSLLSIVEGILITRGETSERGALFTEFNKSFKISGYPRFFVKPDILKAAMNTKLSDICFNHLKYPFKTFVICLPHNVYTTSVLQEDGTRKQYNITELLVNTDKLVTEEDPAISIMAISTDNLDFNMYSTQKMTRSIIELKRTDPNIKTLDSNNGKLTIISDPTKMEEEDLSDLDKMCQIAINLIMIGNSRPELITAEQHIKTATTKNGNKISTYSPRWIGENYCLIYENGPIGSHASPEAHIRKGHFRHQRYGEGFSETKIIWIEPTWINI